MVEWQGDSDGRKGFLAGQISFARAESEKSLTHYNLYWHHSDKPRSFLGKVGRSADFLGRSLGSKEENYGDPGVMSELIIRPLKTKLATRGYRIRCL